FGGRPDREQHESERKENSGALHESPHGDGDTGGPLRRVSHQAKKPTSPTTPTPMPASTATTTPDRWRPPGPAAPSGSSSTYWMISRGGRFTTPGSVGLKYTSSVPGRWEEASSKTVSQGGAGRFA